MEFVRVHLAYVFITSKRRK